jgi:hypothetical protein
MWSRNGGCYRAKPFMFSGRYSYLLTGDGRHFDHLYEKRIAGVLVVRPAQYFGRRRRR